MAKFGVGTMKQLKAGEGCWAFADVGFSQSSKSSCLLVVGDVQSRKQARDGDLLTFGELGNRIEELINVVGKPLHLVIEAPLSGAFGPDGSPHPRSCERRGEDIRYWYYGAGVLTAYAGLLLVNRLKHAKRRREVRIFEGFASFHTRGDGSGHQGDVAAMYEIVRSRGARKGGFEEPKALDLRHSARQSRVRSAQEGVEVRSLLDVLGLGDGLAPVVVVGPKSKV